MKQKIYLTIFFLLMPFALQTDPNIRTVTRVVDGDTVYVSNEKGEEEKIRLIGIDSPELYKEGGAEPFAAEARKYLQSLILNERVRLYYDVDLYDKYGRTLAYIYLDNGTFINGKMIEVGLAKTLSIPPNVAHTSELSDLQRQARNNKLGIWADR